MNSHSPLSKISEHGNLNTHIQIYLKRDDTIHPLVGGNKIRKLWFLSDQIENMNAARIHSMGGPHSNHVAALSHLCNLMNVPLHLYIRETPYNQSPTLLRALKEGSDIQFVSRSAYRTMRLQSPSLPENDLFIPEGGSGDLASSGLKILSEEIKNQFQRNIRNSALCLAAGTGKTALELIQNLPAFKAFFIHPAGKKFGIEKLLKKKLSPSLFDKCRFTPKNDQFTYGCLRPEIIEYIHRKEDLMKVTFDPIYTAPLLYSIEKNLSLFPTGINSLLIYHSGGLQGSEAYFNQFYNQV